MSVLINLENVSFSYDNDLQILQNINLQILDKQKILITGQSGSGKTTLLHILGKLIQPSSGTLLNNAYVSFIFQFHHLLTALNAQENIAIADVIKNKISWLDAMKKSEDLLELVDLKHRKTALISELSGGEKQRVSIARALITKPQVLLCDEPTGSLDEVRAENALQLILELSEKIGTSVVMISHDVSIYKYFDVIYRLHECRLENISR